MIAKRFHEFFFSQGFVTRDSLTYYFARERAEKIQTGQKQNKANVEKITMKNHLV